MNEHIEDNEFYEIIGTLCTSLLTGAGDLLLLREQLETDSTLPKSDARRRRRQIMQKHTELARACSFYNALMASYDPANDSTTA